MGGGNEDGGEKKGEKSREVDRGVMLKEKRGESCWQDKVG